MGLFDSFTSAVSSGLDYLGSAASNIWSGIGEGWSQTGPTAAGPGGGWAGRLGTQLGDIAENVAGGFVAKAVPLPGGGLTGAGPVFPNVPGGIVPDYTLRSPAVYADTTPRSPAGPGLSLQAPIDQPAVGFGFVPDPSQIRGAGFPAAAAASAIGDVAVRGLEFATSEEGQQMIGGLWDMVRGRTAGPGGAALQVAPTEGGEMPTRAIQPFQGPGALPYGGRLFKQTMSGIRANTVVMVRHPQTTEPVFFRHVGRPILFSGDFATARRVDKIAKKAKKAVRRGR